ncbi:hypothetical protein EH223_14425 [candidate division KSB1 bacterium]|nr:hypothetical protein [candidate division KSB1 bacterium]RQW01676.1 MAG: hypothetical protein EH223_14425 [candidate division KSB1 bacterium]
MTPYKLSLKRWLFKTMPFVKSIDLFEHEALLTRGFQQSLEFQQQIFPVFSTGTTTADPLGEYINSLLTNIEKSITQSDNLVDNDELQKTKDFWMKQKVYASMQQDFHQFTFDLTRMWKKTVASAQFHYAYMGLLLRMLRHYLKKPTKK